jgi:hypothetical protein
MVPKLYYITVATKPHKVLDAIKHKVAALGETIEVLGEKEDRFIGWEGTGNFGVKLREVADFLKRPELAPEDVVLFTDAYDVVYCGERNELLRRYQLFSKPIIFGAEKMCQPDPQLASQYPKTASKFPYLNSGMFIGRVWALRECMENYEYVDAIEDQRFWTDRFLNENKDIIELDYENLLFLNTVDINMEKLLIERHGIFTIVMYGTANPMFIHVNGPDKSLLLNLLDL